MAARKQLKCHQLITHEVFHSPWTMSSSLTNDILDLSDELNNDDANSEYYLGLRRKSTNSSSNLYSSSSSSLLNQNLLTNEISPSSSYLKKLSPSTKSLSSGNDSRENILLDTEKRYQIDEINPDDRTHKKREVYKFQTDYLVSSVAWSNELSSTFRLAISSFIEKYSNKIQLVELKGDRYDEEIVNVASFEHPYPATKVLFIPRPPSCYESTTQLLATTADYLRVWRIKNRSGNHFNGSITGKSPYDRDIKDYKIDVELAVLLNANEGSKHCAPLTSFDWNDVDPSLIVTSSVDTTCAIWDLEVSKLLSQIRTSSSHFEDNNKRIAGSLRGQTITQDQEAYDVSFSKHGSGREVFVTVGGNGTVKLFDLRGSGASTTLHEKDCLLMPGFTNKALVRVACNKQDSNLVATFGINSNDILILDVRRPGTPLVTLESHTGNLNSISWAPHSAHHLCSASEDCQALIWELSKLPKPVDEPLLVYKANGSINAISWSASHPDWIGIGYRDYLELLRV